MSESTKFQDYSEEVWPVLEDAIQGMFIDLPDTLMNEIPSSTIEEMVVAVRECMLNEFVNREIGSREAIWNIIEGDGVEDDEPTY